MTASKTPVVCSASVDFEKLSKNAAATLAAVAVATSGAMATAPVAKADVAGLTPCAESKAFAKREKQEIKGLTRRLKQVCR